MLLLIMVPRRRIKLPALVCRRRKGDDHAGVRMRADISANGLINQNRLNGLVDRAVTSVYRALRPFGIFAHGQGTGDEQ